MPLILPSQTNIGLDLEPCPCCGSSSLCVYPIKQRSCNPDGFWIPEQRYIRCLSCGVSGPHSYTLLEAITAWNRRVTPPVELSIRINNGFIRAIPKPRKRKKQALPELKPCPKCTLNKAAFDAYHNRIWVKCSCGNKTQEHTHITSAAQAWNSGQIQS